LQGQHSEWVFTYICRRTKDGRIRGERYPVTYNGLKTEWRRHRKRLGIKDFRFHDKRHDFATKLLRKSGNLKIVQKSLNHADIKTTMRYAHVLDQDVAEAVEAMQNDRKESRNKSRSELKKLAETVEKKGKI
jgi:integrase